MGEMPEDLRRQLEKMVNGADPELLKKYGNPLDEDDPRSWLPSTRKNRGVNPLDRLEMLELDMEKSILSFGELAREVKRIADYVARQQAEEIAEQMKTDPKAAMEKLMSVLGIQPEDGPPIPDGAFGPNGENGPAYAGSTQGVPPDTIVETVDGPIRADQIPGYENSPDWRPSVDWLDANCTCPLHVAQREAAGGHDDNGERPPGMYL